MNDKVKKIHVPYAQISNEMLNSKEISFKAKGLLAYMISKTIGWNFTIKSIISQTKDGQNSVTSAIDELKENGFIVYEKHMDGSGTYHLYQNPELENPNMVNEPYLENPHLENPNLGKSKRISNNIINSNNIKSKKENSLFSENDIPVIKDNLTTDNNKNSSKQKKEGAHDEIDFERLVKYYNKVFGREVRVISDKAKSAFKARLKEGYTKEDIVKVIDNARSDDFHAKSLFKACTFDFLSRSDKFAMFAALPHKKPLDVKKAQSGDVFINP